jgi:hypothetical protein
LGQKIRTAIVVKCVYMLGQERQSLKKIKISQGLLLYLIKAPV